MKLEASAKLVTCILPKGRAIEILESLQAKGIHRANLAFARGSDIHDHIVEEKDIITVVASSGAEADEIFYFLYDKAEINQPGGGIIYITSLRQASPYGLPQI